MLKLKMKSFLKCRPIPLYYAADEIDEGDSVVRGYNHSHEATRDLRVIIFRGADGRTLTMDDLRNVTGSFRYEIVGSTNIPPEAQSLHQQAREAGGRGDHKEAIVLLEAASRLAPRWPYPVYDKAYTLLLMGDHDGAREHYRETLNLAPRGFFTAITALDTLEREQKGGLPTGTYRAYLSLEWIEDQWEKACAVHGFVRRLPQFAPAWKMLASVVDEDNEKLAALEKGLAAKPDAETNGMLLISKALILKRQGVHDVAVRTLGELALDPTSPLGVEHLARFCLATMVQK